MADADYTFAQARTRLEDIVTQVRKKDVSLEKSLDLLEEGVRLANACTEHIDHTEWRSVANEAAEAEELEATASTDDAASAGEADGGVHVPVDAIEVQQDVAGGGESADDGATEE